MSYSTRVYRQRNAHTFDNEANKEQTSFFSNTNESKGSKGGKPSFFQAKLSVGQPNDKYEQEADAVANKVVNHHTGGAPVMQKKEISSIQRYATPVEEEKFSTNDERMKHDKEIQEKPEVQTKCAECEKEEKDKKAPVQMKSEGGGSVASHQLSSKIKSSSGKGNKLPKRTLSEMNRSFGADFSNVHIHTDTEAAQMNKELGAQAFTNGSDIYFNSGKYNTDNADGKFLLAHELTHVVQQGYVSEGQQVQRQPDNLLGGFSPFGEDPMAGGGSTPGNPLGGILGDVVPAPLAVPAWDSSFLSIELFSSDASCAGTASPRGGTLMSWCNVAHFCTTPAEFSFNLYFHFDADIIPRPQPFSDAAVSIALDFVPDGQTAPSFSKHQSGKGIYTGPGNPLTTPFGNAFSFSSSKDGTLSVVAEMTDTATGTKVKYADNIRCTITPCA